MNYSFLLLFSINHFLLPFFYLTSIYSKAIIMLLMIFFSSFNYILSGNMLLKVRDKTESLFWLKKSVV